VLQARSPDPSAWLYHRDFERLRGQLDDARARGESFASAWSPALAAAALTHDSRVAARATRPAWERAYDRAPATEFELRLAQLGGALDNSWTASA
jgi:hypothetical protein